MQTAANSRARMNQLLREAKRKGACNNATLRFARSAEKDLSSLGALRRSVDRTVYEAAYGDVAWRFLIALGALEILLEVDSATAAAMVSKLLARTRKAGKIDVAVLPIMDRAPQSIHFPYGGDYFMALLVPRCIEYNQIPLRGLVLHEAAHAWSPLLEMSNSFSLSRLRVLEHLTDAAGVTMGGPILPAALPAHLATLSDQAIAWPSPSHPSWTARINFVLEIVGTLPITDVEKTAVRRHLGRIDLRGHAVVSPMEDEVLAEAHRELDRLSDGLQSLATPMIHVKAAAKGSRTADPLIQMLGHSLRS